MSRSAPFYWVADEKKVHAFRRDDSTSVDSGVHDDAALVTDLYESRRVILLPSSTLSQNQLNGKLDPVVVGAYFALSSDWNEKKHRDNRTENER